MNRRSSYPGVPKHLSERSKKLWRELIGGRVKSPERVALFQAALEALDRADQARMILAKEGLTFETENTGTVHVHPVAKIEKDARAAFARIWSQLALHWNYDIDGRINWDE
jgi:P27 family predicted phage terminase small subunit